MTSVDHLKQQLLRAWDDLPDDEKLAEAGEMSVQLAEMLASLAIARGNKTAARNLLKAAIELETTVRHVRDVDDLYRIALTGQRLH